MIKGSAKTPRVRKDGHVAEIRVLDVVNIGALALWQLLLRLQRQNETIKEKMEELHRKQTEFTAITENMRHRAARHIERG